MTLLKVHGEGFPQKSDLFSFCLWLLHRLLDRERVVGAEGNKEVSWEVVQDSSDSLA